MRRSGQSKRAPAPASPHGAAMWQAWPHAEDYAPAKKRGKQGEGDTGEVSKSGTGARSVGVVDVPVGPEDEAQDTYPGAVRRRPIVMYLEGCAIIEDKHDDAAKSISYKRLEVVCPCSGSKHFQKGKAACRKRRGLDSGQTRHFGSLEPAAFLGAWLADRAKLKTRAKHVRYVPSKARVERYMRDNGML